MHFFPKKPKKLLDILKIYGIIVVGAVVASLGVSLFLSPLRIVAGGASGVAIILRHFTGLPVGLSMLFLNVPLFLLGWRRLGNGFGVRSVFGTVLFSLFTDLTAPLPALTAEPMLGALAGGALLGLGMGAMFLTGATSGGSDIVARLAHRLLPSVNVGQWLFAVDFLVIAASGIAFYNYELCLYGLIALLVSSYLVDFMLQGANLAKVVYIISSEYERIAAAVLEEMHRGVTGIRAQGMYTRRDKMMLMCVVKRFEIQKLERLARSCDPDAFLIFTQAHQVSGEGFRIYPAE